MLYFEYSFCIMKVSRQGGFCSLLSCPRPLLIEFGCRSALLSSQIRCLLDWGFPVLPELGPPDGPFSLERGLFMDENKDIARATIRLVEARLRQYPVDKKLVEAWEKEKEEVAGALQSSSGHYGEILRGSGLQSDPTFSKVVRLERMAARIDEAKWYVEAIDDVLGMLPDLERRLIEMKYFELAPDVKVMNDLHISSSKYYAIRRKILLLLARRMGL